MRGLVRALRLRVRFFCNQEGRIKCGARRPRSSRGRPTHVAAAAAPINLTTRIIPGRGVPGVPGIPGVPVSVSGRSPEAAAARIRGNPSCAWRRSPSSACRRAAAAGEPTRVSVPQATNRAPASSRAVVDAIASSPIDRPCA